MTHNEAHRLLIRLVKLHATAAARHMAGERGDLFEGYARLHCDLVDLMTGVELPGEMMELIRDNEESRDHDRL